MQSTVGTEGIGYKLNISRRCGEHKIICKAPSTGSSGYRGLNDGELHDTKADSVLSEVFTLLIFPY